MEALCLRGVTKVYRTPVESVVALRDVSLSIDVGDMLCVIGPSGSGKTTLLKVSAGFLRPDMGVVTLMGEEIYKLPLRRLHSVRNRLVGFVFQEDMLIDSLTVIENVELPLIARGVRGSVRRRMAMEALDRLGISKLSNRKVDQISGGERRRVCLAMGVAHRPKVLFADEPTSNLDTESAMAVLEELKALNRDGTTVILATHDSLVAKNVPKTIELRDGKIVREL